MTAGVPRPCIHPDCGELTLTGRCDDHRLRRTRKRPSATQRGYDSRWNRLVKHAIRLQPFCQDCGRTADQLPAHDALQGDHTPEAWARKARGLPIRLQDIAIRCGPCNRAAGAARGPNVTHI
jgi:5-methylcytosine-specific restriction protein A